MRKFFTLFLALLLISTSALADPQTIDLDEMSLEELTQLKNAVNAALARASSEQIDGYTLITDFSEYARNAEAHTGESIRFNGEVIQVVEGIESNLYRITFNNSTDSVFAVFHTPSVESTRLLEGDNVTVMGVFDGLYTYESTLGSQVTVPSCVAEMITDKIDIAGEYAATRQDPAPIGATIRYDGSSYSNEAVTDLTVTKVIRGDAAWQIIRGWNRYNDQPSDSQEYILVSIKTAAISSENDQQAELDDYDFSFVSASGMEYQRESVSGMTPKLTNLYPGAEHEAYVAGMVNKGDQPLLIYLKNSENPIWFDLNKRIPIELPADTILNTLQRGDKSEEVREMQAILVEMGYLSGIADGDFGGKTEAAIREYQTAMGLEATGIADEATLRLILTYSQP